ncbi:hypothetical protein GCM10027296_13180 [Chitinimonas naiadis]
MLSARAVWLRRLLHAFLPLALLALLASLWLWQTERRQASANLVDRANIQLMSSQQEIGNALTESAVDLMLLANDTELQAIAAGPVSSWTAHAPHFLTLLSYKPVYDQIRLLDLQGQERLRVNLNRGDPYVVPPEQLQDKHERDYFHAGLNLSRGRVYLSAWDMNIENGVVERPLKPVIRLVTPFYDKSGTKRGLLVLNLLADQILQRLSRHTGPELRPSLIGQQGQWLSFGGSDDSAPSSPKGRSLPLAKAALWAQMQTRHDGAMEDDNGLWVFRQLNPESPTSSADRTRLRLPFVVPRGPQAWWLLAHHDRAALKQAYDDAAKLALLFGGGMLLLAFVAALLLASRAVKGETRLAREQIFFTLIEQAPLGVVMLDSAGEGYFFSKNWQAMTGLPAELARGQGWLSLLEPVDQRRLQDAIATFLTCGEHPALQMQLRRPDGSRHWVNCLFSSGAGVMLKSVGCLLSFADIQTSKDHEASLGKALQLVQGVVSGSGDPILAVDRNLTVTLVNPALGQVFGAMYRDAPAPGDPLSDWMARAPLDQASIVGAFSQALQGKSKQLRLALGPTRRLFDATFAPMRDETDALTGAILFAQDVTDMARIQARVARSEELFRAVFSGSLDAVFVLEAVKDDTGQVVDFRYLEANQMALAMVNANREQCLGKQLSVVNPAFRELGYFDRYLHAIESGDPFVEEVYLDDTRVQQGWYENRIVPMGWGATMTSRNITARKQAEMALAASEALQRNIFDSSPYAIIVIDNDGLITLFNPAAEQMLGYTAQELIGRHTPALFHDPSELARHAQELSARQGRVIEPDMRMFLGAMEESPSVHEWSYIHKDGRTVPARMTLSARQDAGGRVIGAMAMGYDISEQRRVENERDRLEAVVEILPDIVRMVDLDGKIIYLNAAGRRQWGLAPDAPLDALKSCDGYADWSYQLVVNNGIPQAIAEGSWQGETQWQMPDGRHVDMRQLIVAPRMHGRPPSFTASVLHDLSEVRAMEAKMVEEDALLNSILESVQDAIVVVNDRAEVQALNPAVADLFGYGLHKVMGRPVSMLLPPSMAEQQKQAFQHYMATGEHSGRVIGQREEVMGQRQDGSSFPLELTVTEIHLGKKRLFTWVMRDISERKAFEERLLENIDELQATQEALNAANQQLMTANSELGRMAQQDGLTGVANRRAFDQRLISEWGRAARAHHPLTLLMIDVDHFKRYNDGYGHQMGDECLRRVAGILQDAISRASDFVARYGGEEFAILLPETESVGGEEIAEHIRAGLATANIPHAHSPSSSHVTASVGIATFVPQAGTSGNSLVAAADQALYQAKEQGRNRAVVAAVDIAAAS